MKYDISALEIMCFLGCTEPIGEKIVQQIKAEKKISLPLAYEEFIRYAWWSPILETADMQTRGMPRFLYEDIEERIADEKPYWEKEAASKHQDDCYFQLSQLPREKWPDNYLIIGWDYGAGIVKFGIRTADLIQDDPPVYMQHEGGPITVWHKHWESVSDYLLEVVANALLGVGYETAMEVLEDEDFDIYEYGEEEWNEGQEELPTPEELLEKKGIDLSRVKRSEASWTGSVYCCMEDDTLYIGCTEGPEFRFYGITREREN